MKDAVFVGTALEDLRAFPEAARREAGYQIDLVQQGCDPTDWKPVKRAGVGIREIRIHEEGDYRVLYAARFREAVYILHAFRKKTPKTPRKDIDLARGRYQAVINARK